MTEWKEWDWPNEPQRRGRLARAVEIGIRNHGSECRTPPNRRRGARARADAVHPCRGRATSSEPTGIDAAALGDCRGNDRARDHPATLAVQPADAGGAYTGEPLDRYGCHRCGVDHHRYARTLAWQAILARPDSRMSGRANRRAIARLAGSSKVANQHVQEIVATNAQPMQFGGLLR
jgi:hypothetical protein